MMTDDEIRQAVRIWLDGNWDATKRAPKIVPETEGLSWLRRVFDAGWAVVTWPVTWYGRGWSNAQARVVDAEFAAVGAEGAGQDRRNIFANTLLTFAQDGLKRELIERSLCGEFFSCLLYSEPGAGSDLASLRTRADPTEGGWLINGQKVWTSGAQHSDYALLVARTDWDQPKHKGISYFVMSMRQPGVDVRPIHQITGERHFNEVFIDNAFVPDGNLLGELNGGWKVLQTALAYERLIMGEGAGERRQTGGKSRHAALIDMARAHGKLDDPVIRQQLATAIAYRQLNELNLSRAKGEMAQGTSSPIMSLGKLAMSRILHGDARLRTALIGPDSMLDGADANAEACDVNHSAFMAYMTSIGGGSDQIQRNIIGERVLGLPREVELDRDIPFRQSKAVRS